MQRKKSANFQCWNMQAFSMFCDSEIDTTFRTPMPVDVDGHCSRRTLHHTSLTRQNQLRQQAAVTAGHFANFAMQLKVTKAMSRNTSDAVYTVYMFVLGPCRWIILGVYQPSSHSASVVVPSMSGRVLSEKHFPVIVQVP